MVDVKKLLTKVLTAISTIQGNMSKEFLTVNVSTSSTSVAAYAGVWKSVTKTIASGYTPVGIMRMGVNHGWINITSASFSLSGTTLTVSFYCQNITNAAITCSCDANVLLVRKAFV